MLRGKHDPLYLGPARLKWPVHRPRASRAAGDGPTLRHCTRHPRLSAAAHAAAAQTDLERQAVTPTGHRRKLHARAAALASGVRIGRRERLCRLGRTRYQNPESGMQIAGMRIGRAPSALGRTRSPESGMRIARAECRRVGGPC